MRCQNKIEVNWVGIGRLRVCSAVGFSSRVPVRLCGVQESTSVKLTRSWWGCSCTKNQVVQSWLSGSVWALITPLKCCMGLFQCQEFWCGNDPLICSSLAVFLARSEALLGRFHSLLWPPKLVFRCFLSRHHDYNFHLYLFQVFVESLKILER